MTQLEQQLIEDLLDLDGAVKHPALNRANINLLPIFERIDEIATQFPPGTHSQALHFSQRQRDEKILVWLPGGKRHKCRAPEGRGTQISRGSCGRRNAAKPSCLTTP